MTKGKPMPAHMKADFMKTRYIPPHVKHDEYIAFLHAKAHAKQNSAEARELTLLEEAERMEPHGSAADAPVQSKLPPTAREVAAAKLGGSSAGVFTATTDEKPSISPMQLLLDVFPRSAPPATTRRSAAAARLCSARARPP